MKKLKWMLCAAFLIPSANQLHAGGPFGDGTIPASAAGDGSDFVPAAPWILPEGYHQEIVTDESDLNIYLDPTIGNGNSNDWHDMNTLNETGKHAGRFLYTTHEVRGNAERGGTVTVFDRLTGELKVIAEDPTYDALDGIEWTKWKTVLFAEEVTDGRLLEIFLDPQDPSTALSVVDRPAVGRLAHEGIQVGSDGSVYVIDEFRGEVEGFGGGIYRFVPDEEGDLSSGDLFALKVTGGPFGTGQGEWVGPIDPLTARTSGTAAGGTGYNRPEDMEIIRDTLYVNITEGPRDGGPSQLFDGRVLAVNLETLEVTDFVRPGLNVPVETGGMTGFDNPDNLAQTADGQLVIIEDNVPSDIWIASTKNPAEAVEVRLFASLTDPDAEGSGIYFADPHTMFVNVQHSTLDDNDATWAIIKD